MALEIIDIVQDDIDSSFSTGIANVTIDTTFQKINKNATAFLIWKIENLSVVPLPKNQYDTFCDKDSYLIYAATQYGQPSGPQAISRDVQGAVEYHIHFWLGKYTTAEKAGVAAYKTVELDSYLGGFATQHREVQGKESSRFKSYFTQGMRILSGGIEPGLQEDDEFEASLFQVKGVRAPVLTQMPTVSWEYFNSGDVFLLHTETIIFIWVGRSANAIEKLHSTKAAIQLQTDHNTPNLVFVDDGYEKTLFHEERSKFEEYLPLNKRVVKAADELEDDDIVEKSIRNNIKLYQCSDNSGKYRVVEVKTGPLFQEDLIHDDVMILDHGLNGIWIWVGKFANSKERTEAIRNARGFVKKKKYPNYTAVTRIVDGVEPIEFKMLFVSWHDKDEVKAANKQKLVVKVTRFDAVTMHDRPALAAKCQLFDDGSGTMRIWRIKRLDAVEIPKERFGIFFTADCYVVLYSYKIPAGVRWIVYYWMGYHSILDDQGVAALKAIELDSSLTDNKAMHVRVSQGREPIHFMQLFNGRMRVFNGKGTDLDVSGKNLKTPNHYLLHIQGTATYNTKATQMPLKASSLNSYYCFVLRKINTYYIWCGNKSTGDNREMAKGFAGIDFLLLREGNETQDFWAALCGKQDYISKKLPETSESTMRARLFRCLFTNNQQFETEEILNFVQTDLTPENVMLLDAQNTIYLWIGNLSTGEEQRLNYEIALEYLKIDPRGRDSKMPIIQLRQGFEPPTFTGFFDVWNNKLWKNHKSYKDFRTEIEGDMRSPSKLFNYSNNDFNMYNKYSASILKGPVEDLPISVDPLKKELHLTYDDFVSIFGIEYTEFTKLPLWKQQEMKKHVGLF